MILRSEFTIRVYIVYFMSCQKNIFDNLDLDYKFDDDLDYKFEKLKMINFYAKFV
jgi:hypothetical protein